jgi:DNA-binding FadR family transcriptional regulator
VAAARWRDVIEVRRTLEVGAAHLAARRRTAADLDRMRELLAVRASAVGDGDLDGVVLADVALHRAIGDATHNPMLVELYGTVLGALYDNVRRNVEAQAPQDDDDHSALVDAIAAADPELAAREAAAILDSLLCRPGPPPGAAG